MRCTTLSALILALPLAACGSDSTGPDGDDVVTIEMRTGNVFSPATRQVPAGTTVRWVNEDAVPHNTTSTQGAWASSNLQPDQTFQRTFGTAGTFPYECTIHPGMTGTITVQ